VVYRPKDVVFCETLVLELFSKKPIGTDPLDEFLINMELLMEIYDPLGQKIFQTNAKTQDGTCATTWAIPGDISGGEYEIKISN